MRASEESRDGRTEGTRKRAGGEGEREGGGGWKEGKLEGKEGKQKGSVLDSACEPAAEVAGQIRYRNGVQDNEVDTGSYPCAHSSDA